MTTENSKALLKSLEYFPETDKKKPFWIAHVIEASGSPYSQAYKVVCEEDGRFTYYSHGHNVNYDEDVEPVAEVIAAALLTQSSLGIDIYGSTCDARRAILRKRYRREIEVGEKDAADARRKLESLEENRGGVK